ncbi:protoporphyrinogen oxidase [Paenibacillus baekrokdamisoli]|uniref:Coproporphyrinogen III oxidase n=2 Tax=Paenibacillus baekrokdamisoli TaxID=1712516 RepID=A0A3G9IJN5_9BACL|nr:protoporphyrinogen oxidase [Paenibacillus baekrokdamisoli]BBH19120.1 protoporphyrinogen oxidase [Paenibacillus baekrokdamisoli]
MRREGLPDRFVVIGGGISGLSSAFYLLWEAHLRGRAAVVTLVDPSERLGGKINTLKRDGFVIEKGPDSFLARKTPIIDLARDLGIAHELVGTNPAAKKTYILHKGKLHAMPPGLVLGIPTEIAPFAKSSLLSWGGKLRAFMDFLKPASKDTDDESLGDFLTRRLGPEVMERVAEPLLAGIYAGDLRKLSLQATFPQFKEAERKHGSLIRGMRANKRKAGAVPSAGPSSLPAAVRSSVFMTFRGGLATMIDALNEALVDVDRRLGVKAVAFRQNDPMTDGEDVAPYEVLLSSGEVLDADGIVITAPAFDAADLLEPHINVDALRAVQYVSVANVVMAFDKKNFGIDFDGSGFVVPRSEGTTITACTWTSAKWLHSSPSNKVLLRCYVGRSGDEEVVDLPDDQLTEAVRKDIRDVMGITATPLFTEITRLHKSMPQYPVGHLQETAKLRTKLRSEMPGVWVTGAAFDGVGLPDCIRQGKEAAVGVYKSLFGEFK